MADIFGKVEGVAGLALLGGLAYGAIKLGPGIIKAFKDAMGAFKSAGETASDVASGVASAAGDVVDVVKPPNLEDSLGDLYDAAMAPNPDPFQVSAASARTAWDIIGRTNPGQWLPARMASSIMGALGQGGTSTETSSSVRFVSGSAADRNADANLAKKRAAWQAAQDARTEAVKLLVQERNSALAYEREARRIKNEEQYNAWLRSTRPAESVSNFLNVGKQYQGQQEVAPGVYVAPSGAYQIIQDGQIVAGGSAGAVQGAIVKANTDMYPGTDYRREVVEGYQAKARAGDAAASAWLKRFAPAGAV